MKNLLPPVKSLLGISGLALLLSSLSVAHAQTIYSDNFDRTGDLNGSSPATDLSGATWATSLPTVYSTSTTGGGEVTINPGSYTYQGAYLPVNGVGSSLGAGLLNFTLTATETPGTEGTSVGLALLDAPLGNYAGYNTGALGYITDQGYPYINGNYYFGVGLSGTAILSISYNALAGTLAYSANGTIIETDTGITPAQIAALTDVSFGFGGNNTPETATAESFSLVVAVPEPSTWMLLLGSSSVLALVLNRRRRLA